MYSQLTSDLPQSRMMGYNPETYKKELALMNKERSTRNIVDVNPEKYAPSLEEKGSLGSRSRSCSESGSLLNPELFVHGSLKEPTPVNSEEINGNNQKDTDLSSRHHHYKSFAEQVEKAVSKGDWRVVEQLAKSANKDGGRPESPVSSLDSRSVSENSSQPRPRLSIIDQDRASRVSKLIEENDWAAVEAAAANFGDEDSSRMHKENRNSATSAASSLTVDSGADNDNDEQFKRTVTSILLKVAPEEAKNVSALIEQFQGREAELLATLHSMFEQKIEKDRSDQKLQPPDHYSPAEEGAVSDDRRDSLSSMLGLSDASSHESLSQGEKEKKLFLLIFFFETRRTLTQVAHCEETRRPCAVAFSSMSQRARADPARVRDFPADARKFVAHPTGFADPRAHRRASAPPRRVCAHERQRNFG